jgi:hypothetical protein
LIDMKKLAFVLAAAGIMTLPACNQQTPPHAANAEADLSPLNAPPVNFEDGGVLSEPTDTITAPAAL